MKNICVAFLVFCGFFSFASHSIGGFVSWKNVGPGKFVFRAELLSRCYFQGADPIINQSLTGPQGMFTMYRRGSSAYSSSCYNPGFHCWNTGAIGPVSRIVYESDTITLTGTPPPSGWKFSFQNSVCCGSQATNMQVASNQSLDVYSVMYPETVTLGLSSPYFVESYDQAITPYNHIITNQAFAAHAGDSLYYSLVSPSLGSSAVPYNAGFSYTEPFPETGDSPANGPISFNPYTGSFDVDVQVGHDGYYGYTVEVEQWHMVDNGPHIIPVKVSKIRRDYQVPLSTLYSNNSAPAVSIDTTYYKDVHQVTSTDYVVLAEVGDTVKFNIQALDYDLDSIFFPQQITFDAKGAALDSSWGGWELYSSVPFIVPVSPGFTNPASNVVSFKWPITADMVDTSDAYHAFSFTFTDNYCLYMGRSAINLMIKIEGPEDTTSSSGVGVNELYRTGVNIYPNPANESFTVDGLVGKSQIQILDVQGKLLKSYSTTDSKLVVERENLPSGVYFVKISDANTTSLHRVMFE